MKLAQMFEQIVGDGSGVRFVAYDGSAAGPTDAEATIDLRSRTGLRYIATAPGDLGFARAFVTGHLDIEGDLHFALQSLLGGIKQEVGWSDRAELLRALGTDALRPPPRPAEEAPPPIRRGRRHSKARDAAAIQHHYDVSNLFYSYVLGPTMAYTCAVYEGADATLEQAQSEKFDLVCRKLGLEPGMRLLDVGCGWGGMVMHAAEHYGVTALGVTLAGQQAEWGAKAIVDAGLSDRAEVRHLDYRDVREGDFDAVSSIGLTEHIGIANLPSYFSFLAGRLRPGGRLLNHCITRPNELMSARTGRLHRPLRLPRRRARGHRHDRLRDEQQRLRGPARGEPARALRDDPARLVGQPRRTLGRSGRRGRARAGPGLASLPGRVAGGLREEPHPAAPGPRRTSRGRCCERDGAAPGLVTWHAQPHEKHHAGRAAVDRAAAPLRLHGARRVHGDDVDR